MDARRFMRRHNDSGYIIMSAELPENTKEENAKATKKLVEELKSNSFGFNFIKVYGTFNKGELRDDREVVSFIVLPYRKDVPVRLGEFVISCRILACSMKQKTILIKESRRDVPYFWTCWPHEADNVYIVNRVEYNDNSRGYYIDFRKGMTGKLSPEKRASRFSFV